METISRLCVSTRQARFAAAADSELVLSKDSSKPTGNLGMAHGTLLRQPQAVDHRTIRHLFNVLQREKRHETTAAARVVQADSRSKSAMLTEADSEEIC